LIKDLDDDEFDVRERATEELIKLAKPALPAVREALKSSSAEVRGCAERILDRYVQKAQPAFALKPLSCREELETYFPKYRFYLASVDKTPSGVVLLDAENEVKYYALKEDHKTKETALLKEIKKVGVAVKDRKEAEKFGLVWLLLAYGNESFKVETTDHQNETRY
jgi:hypothetical protein